LLAGHSISGGLTAVAQHVSICEPLEFEAVIRGALDPRLDLVLVNVLIHAVTQGKVSALSFLPVFPVVAVGIVICIDHRARAIENDPARESTQDRNTFLTHRLNLMTLPLTVGVIFSDSKAAQRRARVSNSQRI
jgi:hypothetical protein